MITFNQHVILPCHTIQTIMLLMKPGFYPILALLLMVSGCNSGDLDLNELNAPGVDGVSAQSLNIGSASGSESAQNAGAGVADNDVPAEPMQDAGELQVDAASLPSDDPTASPSDDTVSIPSDQSENTSESSQSFQLTLNRTSATLTEGDSDGTTFVIEASTISNDSIELALEPETSLDGQGIEVSLDQTDLDSTSRSTFVTFTMQVGMYPLQAQQRTFILRAIRGVETVTWTITLDVMPVSAPDVYLLIGQSNMTGSSEEGAKQVSPGGADEPNSRIRQLNVTHNDVNLYTRLSDFSLDDRIAVEPRLIQAQDPLHAPLGLNTNQKSGTQVGAGISFAKAALADTTQSIYLVPAAWGASGFCDELDDQLAWNAEPTDNPALGGTGLLERAIARLNLTLRETDGVFRGILWHQGEADSGRSACASSYAQNLVQMVERIRTDAIEDVRGASARGAQAPIPFIAGTMSKGVDSRGDYSNWSDNKGLVDAVHRQITDLLPFADWVNNDDLVPAAYPCGSGACVHFGSLALREMGQRYYQALERVR